jgi:hypothetical protein
VVVAQETAYVVDDVGRLWSSPDGREWSLQIDARLEGSAEGLYVGPDGELLLLEHPDWETEDEDPRMRLWRSADGKAWTEVALPELEWVGGITWIGDRYFITGWDSYRARVWVSDPGFEWIEPDISGYEDISMPAARTGDRLFITVQSESEGWPVTHVLYSDDGLHWTETGAEFRGWSGEIVDSGGLLALQIYGEGWERDVALWTSQDGIDWVELGSVPTYRESWTQLLPSNDGRIRVLIEGEYRSASIWEWIPPEED